MPKLVVLSESLAGHSHEFAADKVTIGRMDDNALTLAESSVSSHHCEVVVNGNDLVIKDLNSTNGTFVNGEKVSDGMVKSGQTFRLGQVEIRFENGTAGAATPAVAPASAAAVAAAAADKKRQGQLGAVPQGVKINDLDKSGRPVNIDKNSPFAKKKDNTKLIFLGVFAVLLLAIAAILVFAFIQMGSK